MTMFDLPLDQLVQHRPDLPEPADLDGFWRRVLTEARALSRPLVTTPVDTRLALVDTRDLTFTGDGGHPVRAWVHRPAAGRGHPADEPLPCVVEYIGYGGGRGLAHERLRWALAGYVHVVMDSRGQGSDWSVGSTPDPVGSGPAHPGFMTRGAHSPDELYLRRLATDAVLLVDAVRQLPGVNPARVLVSGASQGGGLALIVAALQHGLAGVLADVPFLCDIRRNTTLTDEDPYAEIRRYLTVHRAEVERTFATLAYVDAAVLAPRAGAPALFSVALMDLICPPSGVYAAYNRYGGPADIEVYAYNGHEGGGAHHEQRQHAWVADLLSR